MKLFILLFIIVLIPIVYILIFLFLSSGNKGKLVCPVDNCLQSFTNENEYLEHLREYHREYFDYDHIDYEENIW